MHPQNRSDARTDAPSDLASLREEVRTLQREKDELATRVQALAAQVDLLTARARRQADSRAAEEPAAHADAAVPRDLTVVKVAPPAGGHTPSRAPARLPRVAPTVPTAVAIQEPDAARLEAALGHPPRRALAVEAEQELREAEAMSGLNRAHALEDFTAHYPQHPYADNALVDAALAYDAAGREDAACALARRVVDEYPAGDAQSDALERLAACAARRGDVDEAHKLVARLRADFPGTPATQRAEALLSQRSGRDGEAPPRDLPARSGP